MTGVAEGFLRGAQQSVLARGVPVVAGETGPFPGLVFHCPGFPLLLVALEAERPVVLGEQGIVLRGVREVAGSALSFFQRLVDAVPFLPQVRGFVTPDADLVFRETGGKRRRGGGRRAD